MIYDRQTMLKVINSDQVLSQMYLALVKEMTIDAALQRVFKQRIENSVIDYYRDLWRKMSDNVDDRPIVLEGQTPVEKEITTLIRKYGWEEFITGLQLYTAGKRKLMAAAGSAERAKEWENIKERLLLIRKKVLE